MRQVFRLIEHGVPSLSGTAAKVFIASHRPDLVADSHRQSPPSKRLCKVDAGSFVKITKEEITIHVNFKDPEKLNSLHWC